MVERKKQAKEEQKKLEFSFAKPIKETTQKTETTRRSGFNRELMKPYQQQYNLKYSTLFSLYSEFCALMSIEQQLTAKGGNYFKNYLKDLDDP
jgi:hypothetical protein